MADAINPPNLIRLVPAKGSRNGTDTEGRRLPFYGNRRPFALSRLAPGKGAPLQPAYAIPPCVTVQDLSRRFVRRGGAPLPALEGVSLVVESGQFAAIVGPSGCGKSTLLRIMAGLDVPTSGMMRIEGAAMPLGASGYMPQRDLLLPWRTVLDNATLGLEYAHVPRAEARERARVLLQAFGLVGFEGASPAELSGGMRQRVALLRTVLAGRPLLLLDEPFGALDAITRAELHEWLTGLLAELQATVILVTHDLEEAAYLSDVVHVMGDRPGRIVASIPILLPRPRPYEVTASAEFAALKGRLLAALRGAHVPATGCGVAGTDRRTASPAPGPASRGGGWP